MSKKLWALNLLLVALIVVGGWQIRVRWQNRVAAQERFLRQVPQPAPAPAVILPPQPGPVQAAAYVQVANELILSKDRNPIVVIETPPVKEMPPLPRYYGMMNFGQGPRIVLAAASGQPQKTYMLGDKIGDFTLFSASNSELVFEWDGKKVPAKIADLKDKEPVHEAPMTTVAKSEMPAAKPAAPAVVGGNVNGPGKDLGETVKACQPGDTSPNGAVVAGFRKIISKTPFGDSCRWERVQ